ncbi:MAG: DUF3047 domain-containing protein [Piscinibacter sp.]|nr:DUF3047 domain-containing protein [Piscinibacter sp.]
MLQPFGAAGEAPSPPWQVALLPRQREPATRFTVVDLDGRRALRVEAEASYGNLVHPLQVEAAGLKLAWQWRIDDYVDGADLRRRDGDDTPLKVCVFYDQPLAQLPFVDRQLLRLARSRSGTALPAATLCYVWDPRLPAGTTLHNAYTQRLRYLVLDSGADRTRRWIAQRRDIAADFLRLFGDESDRVPPVIGVAVGADADNTMGHSLAYVADLVLAP